MNGYMCEVLTERLRLRTQVATKVAEEALSQGLGGIEKPEKGMRKYIEERMWEPSKANLNLSRIEGL